MQKTRLKESKPKSVDRGAHYLRKMIFFSLDIHCVCVFLLYIVVGYSLFTLSLLCSYETVE